MKPVFENKSCLTALWEERPWHRSTSSDGKPRGTWQWGPVQIPLPHVSAQALPITQQDSHTLKCVQVSTAGHALPQRACLAHFVM